MSAQQKTDVGSCVVAVGSLLEQWAAAAALECEGRTLFYGRAEGSMVSHTRTHARTRTHRRDLLAVGAKKVREREEFGF